LVFIAFTLLAGSYTAAQTVEGTSKQEGNTPTEISEAEDQSVLSTEGFDQAFRKMKSQDHLQFELTEAPPPPKIDWLERLMKQIASFFSAISPLLVVMFWIFVAGCVGILLYIVVQAILGIRLAHRQRQDGANSETPLYRPSQQKARILLNAVDALAAKGQYAEAVHLLLYRSIQDIGLTKPNMIKRSLTSREISTLASLSPETRQAFTLIATEVEHSHFGGRGLDKAVFSRCRKAYAQFAVPEPDEDVLTLSEAATA
jgi:hypothetical protein